MELEIIETTQTIEPECLGHSVEPTQKINVQIFSIDDLKQSLEYLKTTCILPLIRKTDFDTISQLMVCYRTILASFETLKIGQEIIQNNV